MRAFIVSFFIAGLTFFASPTGAEESHTTGMKPVVEPLAGQAADPVTNTPTVTLLFQPLGFLQFGPIVELEFRLAPGLYMGAHVRFQGLGLLSHVIALEYTEVWSIAGGIGIRGFPMAGGAPEAFFIGGAVEVGVNGYYDDIGYASAYHGTSIFVVTAVNGGFRWRFGNFILEAGAYVGVSPTLSSMYSYDSAPSVMLEGTPLLLFFGMGELSLGWEL